MMERTTVRRSDPRPELSRNHHSHQVTHGEWSVAGHQPTGRLQWSRRQEWPMPRQAGRSLLVLLLLLAGLGMARRSWADAPGAAPDARLWADVGLGGGSMQASSGPPDSHGAGLWLDLQLGARLGRHWLAGFDLGGIGLHPSSTNYDPNNPYSNIYSDTVTHQLAVLRFQPGDNRGWFAGTGVGRVLYGNRALESLTGNTRSGNGSAVLGRAGYDWPIRSHVHVEAELSVEGGSISLNAPLMRRFHYSIVAAGVHVAYH
jgi:hypothetical protein